MEIIKSRIQKSSSLAGPCLLFVAFCFLKFDGFGQFSLVSGQPFVLVGGTIYTSPAEDPIHDGVILIRDGRIVSVGNRGSVNLPADVESLDCLGMTITAGFWNSHVHFFERKWSEAAAIPAEELGRQLEDMLTQYGFTSVFDLGSQWENTKQIRNRIESGEVPGPRIRTTGEALVAKNALPPDLVFRMMGLINYPTPEILDAAEAVAASKGLLEAGADGIKIHLQQPPSPNSPFPVEAISATVNVAQQLGKPVFAHPATGQDVLAAANAGVDVIVHTTPTSGPWDESIITAMKDNGVALTPTLTLWKYFLRHDRISTQQQVVETAVGQLRVWVDANGTVLFGTDLGAVDYDPSEEYALMAEAGMDFRQILASLTTAPAEKFGELHQLGRIAPGFSADITILKNDPSEDISSLVAVEYTIREGKIIYRRSE